MTFDYPGIKELLSPWDYSQAALETYGRALTKAMANDGSRGLLLRTRESYASGAQLDMRGVLAEAAGFAAALGESAYTLQVLPYLCMLEPAREKYAAAGLPERIFVDSFADILYKTRECEGLYGVAGSFVAPWFYRFFELKCFALGRLQFEFAQFKADGPLQKGERVINVHIPSSGPLRREDCEASYAEAAGFFGFAGRKYTPFVCDSWLLHPLCSRLPEGSGIRRFASDYELLFTIDDADFGDMWIIFGAPYDGHPEKLPGDTALRRIFRERLISGGSVGRGYGLYLRKNSSE